MYQYIFLMSSTTGELTYSGPVSRKSGRLNPLLYRLSVRQCFGYLGLSWDRWCWVGHRTERIDLDAVIRPNDSWCGNDAALMTTVRI